MLSVTKATAAFLDKHCADLDIGETRVSDAGLDSGRLFVWRASDRHYVLAWLLTLHRDIVGDPQLELWRAPSGAWVPLALWRWGGTHVVAVECEDDVPVHSHRGQLRKLVGFCDTQFGRKAARRRAALDLIHAHVESARATEVAIDCTQFDSMRADAQTAAVLDAVTQGLVPGKGRCIDNAPGLAESLLVQCIAQNLFATEQFHPAHEGLPAPRVEWWRTPKGGWLPVFLVEPQRPAVVAVHVRDNEPLSFHPAVMNPLLTFCNRWLGQDVLREQGGIDGVRAASADPDNETF